MTTRIVTSQESRLRVFLLVITAVLKFVADQALPTFILLLSIQIGVNYVVLTLYSGHVVPRSMMHYTLRSDPEPPSHVPPYQFGNAQDTQWWSWWPNVVRNSNPAPQNRS